MKRKKRELGNDTYFTVFNKDLKLIKDPVKKILFAKIKNWVYRNEDKESKTHFKDGHYWTYGSYAYWAEECGLDSKTVGEHLRQLVASGILKSGNYNKLPIDKTIWYRLATDDEMKRVDLRLLHYGKTKLNNPGNHSNESLLGMYQNGMIEVGNKDLDKEELGLALPEHISEYTSEHISEKSSEFISEQNTENNIKVNLSTIEDYNKLINENDIKTHVDYFLQFNIEDIPNKIIKIFFDRFHDSKIDSIENEEKLFSFKWRIEGMYEKILVKSQLEFLKLMVNKYHSGILSPQLAEQKSDKDIPMNASSPRIPLDPSSPNEGIAA